MEIGWQRIQYKREGRGSQKAGVLTELNATQFKHLQPKTDENLDYSSEEKTTSDISSFIHQEHQNNGNAQSYHHPVSAE